MPASPDLSVRYLPAFLLPGKAQDLVDQACAVAWLATLAPQGMEGTGCPFDGLKLEVAATHCGGGHIASVMAARCGIPVGRLTADEGVRSRGM